MAQLSAITITVLDGYTLNPGDNPWAPVSRLGSLTVYDRTPEHLIIERAQDADIILTNKTPLTAATLEQLPRLRFICELATGFDNIDTQAAARLGIPVANVPEYSTASVAQHTMALLLELCSRVGRHAASVSAGEWSSSPDFSYRLQPLTELAGKTLGIVGFGRIGRQVATIAHAMGMSIAASAPRPKPTPAHLPVTWLCPDDLFRSADVVSLHCPACTDTVGFVDRRLLRLMKPTAFIINTARGTLINEQDLADALNTGTLSGAGLDVVAQEPIAPENPLLQAANCIITPHIAWASLAARKRLTETAAGNIETFLAGTPQHTVNTPITCSNRPLDK